MYKALGTLLQRGCKVAAHVHTGIVGSNNAIVWTAVTEGTAGNSITIDLDNPGGNGTLSVAVVTNAITVTLARTGGAITSTAAQVIAAIRASNAASALVIVENDSTSTGAGTVTDTGSTPLADGSETETYTTVAEVGDVSGPALASGTIDTTSHDSASGWREYLTTLKDGGQVTFPISFDPQNVTHDFVLGLVKDYTTGYLRNFKVIFTDTALTPWLFTGYVTGFVPAEPVEGKLGASVTIKLSGVATLS